MKKYRILAYVVSLLGILPAISEDGELSTRINVFLKDGSIEVLDSRDVLGAGLTTVDVNGEESDRYVSHYFYVGADSAVVCPLEMIDSVTFGSGSAIRAKDNAMAITEEFMGYISFWNGREISVDRDIPRSLLPRTGGYIYRDSSDEIFPGGLCGEVEGIDTGEREILIRVREVSPSLVFDEFIVDTQVDEDKLPVEISAGEDEWIRPEARVVTFDGKHLYRMQGHISLKGSTIRYDALTGNLFGKFTVDFDGLYRMHYSDGESVRIFNPGDSVAIPVAMSERSRKYLNPEASVKMTVSERAASGNMDLELRRKYSTSFYLNIADGDTVIYRPTVTHDGEPYLKFGQEPFLDGTLTVTSAVTVSLRPLFSHRGIKVVLSSGPTLKSSVGTDALASMSKEYIDSLYDKSSFELSTSLTAKGFTTFYKGNDIIAEKVMKTPRGPLVAKRADGAYYIFPKPDTLVTTLDSGKGLRFNVRSRMPLLSPLSIGYETFRTASSEVVRSQAVSATFGAEPMPVNELDVEIPFGGELRESNAPDFSTRMLVSYAGYLLKGPDRVNDACTPDGGAHPHAIDLGLPSGTKWACCHVGANTPEEYGDKFRQYSDFSGGAWDSTWSLPTLTQVNELVNKCRWQFTYRNGVRGWVGIGPNGNRIFMPASGYISDDGKERYDTDQCMVIWSSSRKGNLGYRIYFLDEEGEGITVPMEIRRPELYMYPDDESRRYFGAFRLVRK